MQLERLGPLDQPEIRVQPESQAPRETLAPLVQLGRRELRVLQEPRVLPELQEQRVIRVSRA